MTGRIFSRFVTGIAAALCLAAPAQADLDPADVPDMLGPCGRAYPTPEAFDAALLAAGWTPVSEDTAEAQTVARMLEDARMLRRGLAGTGEDRILNLEFLIDDVGSSFDFFLELPRYTRDGAALGAGAVDYVEGEMSNHCLLAAQDLPGADELLSGERAETLDGPVLSVLEFLAEVPPTFGGDLTLWRWDIADAAELGLTGRYGAEFTHSYVVEN